MHIYRKYAPQSFDEFLGNEKAVKNLLRIRDNGGFGGRAYWITGQSGFGKTTLANLIARSIASESDIEEFESFGINGSKIVDMERALSFRSLFSPSGGRVVIFNEAHGLRKDGIRQLLVTLERIPAHVVWIFTTSNDGAQTLFDDYDDAAPLVSRCIKVALSNQGLAKPFAERCKQIAKAEGFGDVPLPKLVALANEHNNNMRAMLSAIESGKYAA